MDSVGRVQRVLLVFFRLLAVVGFFDLSLDLPHLPLDVDRTGAVVAADLHAFVTHLLQVVVLAFVGIGRRGGGGADVDPNVFLFTLPADLAERVEIEVAMLVVGFRAPADVVDAVGDGEDGRPAIEDVFPEPCQAAGRGIAAEADVEEADLALGVAEEGVVLDELSVGAGGGDAVAEEGDGVTVLEGEVVAVESGCRK